MAQNKPRPEVGKVCKAYTGAEGLKITTCRVGPEEKNEALLGFSDVDHPWSGKIFKAKMKKFKNNSNSNNFNIDYSIEWKGKEYVVLTYRDGYGSGFTAYLMPFGSLQAEHKLAYNEYASQSCSPERFLTEYLEQQ
ncbi:MAG: hypothetical protein KF746_01380 [Chitinophagaceae bacterium]|nr:hypothetical protein [Chitinophagaceae bacterium]